jgi:glycosyltransferase involved in cell wall biosynthesis
MWQMQQARFLVFPSIWYEGLPLTILEAFANGLPVISSRLGGMVDLIQHGQTGLHFTPGDTGELACVLGQVWDAPQQISAMKVAARKEFEDKYTPERNLDMLRSIYEAVIQRD